MPRYRFCPDCGDMHDTHAWPDNHRRPDEVLCAPYAVMDTIGLTEHIDGKHYDSKRMFRKVTRQNGCVEVGTDAGRLKPKPKAKPDKEGIFNALKAAKEIVGDMPKKRKRKKAA